jgi:dienelactone hydrolase
MPTLTPHLSLEARPTASPPQAIVLVLHGGRDVSAAATQARQLSVLRMVPFARRIAERGQGRVVVARLRFAVRGWNGRTGEPAPVLDTRWALAQLRDQYGSLPIGLVGHSMGGRTALRCGGEAGVAGVVGLAPWLPPGEPSTQLAGRRVLLVHGAADRMTSPDATAAFANRLEREGVATSLVTINGEKHAMLHQPRLWHELAAQFVLSTVLPDYEPSGWPQAPNFLHEVIAGQSRVTC